MHDDDEILMMGMGILDNVDDDRDGDHILDDVDGDHDGCRC